VAKTWYIETAAHSRVLFFLFNTLRGRLIIFGALMCIPLSLSYNGFCFKKRHFLSDDEATNAMIKFAVETSAVLARMAEQTDAAERIIPYRDSEEFKRGNPECCEIVPHNVPDETFVTPLHQLLGYAAKSVHVTYKVRYLDAERKPQTKILQMQGAVTNCGQVFNALN
jgi:hypothetical protein